MYKFATGFMRSISILLGLLLGTFVAYFMGKVNFAAVADASWLHLPTCILFRNTNF